MGHVARVGEEKNIFGVWVTNLWKKVRFEGVGGKIILQIVLKEIG
jgi:hypothetical protein